MTQQNLFANYELDNSKWKAIITKFVGGSLAVHLILFLSAVYVPAVRDAFYVAMLFKDVPAWAEKDYEKTEITEVISVSSDKFRYPEGYFNNGEYVEPAIDPTSMAQNTDPNGFQTLPPPTFEQAAPTPNPFPPPAVNPNPTTVPPFNSPARRRPGRTGSVLPPPIKVPKGGKVPEFEAKTGTEGEKPKDDTAKVNPSPSPEKTGGVVPINKKPWLDLGDKVTKMLDNKELDLNQLPAFTATIEGDLDVNGKLIAPQLISNTGDPKMVKLATDFVATLNDSEMLMHVKNLTEGTSKRKIRFNLSKDDKEMLLQIVSEIGDKNKAQGIQSKLNGAFQTFAFLAQNGSDEKLMLESVKVETGNNGEVIINWKMPTDAALNLAKKKLDEAKNKPPKENGGNLNTNTEANAKK